MELQGIPQIFCPNCGSTENQGVSHPVPALYGEHDIEQLFLCLGCGEEFVATYIFHKNIKKEDSSVF